MVDCHPIRTTLSTLTVLIYGGYIPCSRVSLAETVSGYEKKAQIHHGSLATVIVNSIEDNIVP